MFHLYDLLNTAFEESMEKLLLTQQTKYYTQQFKLLKNALENMKSVRHDLKNHLLVLETFISQDEKEKALDYISQIMSKTYAQKEYACSGNIDIDSILNFKFEEAKGKDIDIDLELIVPNEINITAFDMVVILGNLLDNAIYATSKLKKDRRIDVQIIYKKEMLFIRINNTFDGQVHYDRDKIITIHSDKENHGIGLDNIQNTLEKYNGTMTIHHTENTFYVEALMYAR